MPRSDERRAASASRTCERRRPFLALADMQFDKAWDGVGHAIGVPSEDIGIYSYLIIEALQAPLPGLLRPRVEILTCAFDL